MLLPLIERILQFSDALQLQNLPYFYLFSLIPGLPLGDDPSAQVFFFEVFLIVLDGVQGETLYA